MISWLQMFSSSSPRYHVKVTCTPPLCLELGWAIFELEQQPSVSLFGHSKMGGTITVCQQHEMCYFEGCYQVLQGYHHQEPESA